MSSVETDDLLGGALEAARRAGADQADAILLERARLSLGWRLGSLEELERKEERELGLRVILGQRQAIASTAVLQPQDVRSLAEQLVQLARHLPADPYVGLADPAALCRSMPDLDIADPEEPSVDSLIEAARAAEDAARAVPGITNSEGGSTTWSRTSASFAASNGFHGSYTRTSHGLGATVLAGSGTAMERDYEWRQATHRRDLPTSEEIGRKAGERTVRRLGARKVATQDVPVVYDPRVASGLVRHLASAINGAIIARGTSFLKDRLGEQLFASDITIVDDPCRRRGLASRPFDDEGMPSRRHAIVDRGVLTTWLLDLASARQLGLSSTGHASRSTSTPPTPSPSNLVLEPGQMSPDELMSDIEQGFYVTELMGMGINMTTGDYSRGAAGFWIEKGKISYPVSEVTIAGNLLEMFRRLRPAHDLEIKGVVDAPTVRVDGMTVAGT